jgi:hypothetical protein
MGFFKAKEKSTAEVPARVKGLATDDLTRWADVSIMELGALFDQWRFHGGSLRDVHVTAETLVAILTEVDLRTKEQ